VRALEIVRQIDRHFDIGNGLLLAAVSIEENDWVSKVPDANLVYRKASMIDARVHIFHRQL
jgi:hypothetical protein